MKQLLYKTTFVASLLSLLACNTVHCMSFFSSQQEFNTVQPDYSAEQYLQQAANANSPQQEYYQLMAAEKLLQQNKTTRALQILAAIDTHRLPYDISVKKQILLAKVQLKDQKPEQALRVLADLRNNRNLSVKNQIELHELLALSYEKTGNIVAAIEQRNELDALLSQGDARSNNQLQIWESLQHLSKTDLATLLSHPLEADIRGWLDLALIAEESSNNPQSLLAQLEQWKRAYPDHTANDILAKEADYSTQALTKLPQQIYLLLPLTGPYAKNGQAVRDGFLAAYNENKALKQTNSHVYIIDTSSGDIVTLYQSAVDKGADFIVGPLTKAEMLRLTQHTRLTVPTLSLNYIPNLNIPNLYQFGLAQYDEAEQVATRAYQTGYQRAIVIAPDSEFGQSVASRFKETWQQNGGKIVDALAYKDTNDLSAPIRNLLQISNSEERAKNLQQVLREEIRSVPIRREDFDIIFLVAMPDQAKSILPMLKFYYAGNIPVYATSLVFEPTNSSEKNADLDRILFADMPWVIGGLNPKMQHLQEKAVEIAGNSDQANAKFFALGVDANELTSRLAQLALFPNYSVEGATGMLFLKNDHHVYRKLKWAEMKDGQPVSRNNA